MPVDSKGKVTSFQDVWQSFKFRTATAKQLKGPRADVPLGYVAYC